MIRKRTDPIITRRGAGLISSITKLPSTIINKAGSVAGTVLNRTVDFLPVELHLPGGYQFCGPGTKLQERLQRGDKGINPLDQACRLHDIAYYNNKDSKTRAVADRELAERAWQRVKASDSSLGEKAAAWAVTNIMKVKSKLGGRLRRKKYNTQKMKNKNGRGLYLRPYPVRSGGGYRWRKKKFRRRRRRQQQQRPCYC